MGWLMGLEPTTTGITIRGIDAARMRPAAEFEGFFLSPTTPSLLELPSAIPTRSRTLSLHQAQQLRLREEWHLRRDSPGCSAK